MRESVLWLLGLLAALLVVRVLPAPDVARGLSSYLPLHTIMEILSIAVAAMVFGIAWVTQKYRLNGRALVLGIGLLGVALLDVSHALSYAGMPDFVTPSHPEKAINFWLAARGMAAIALLWAAFWPAVWDVWLNRHWRYLGLALAGVAVLGVHYVLLLHPEVIRTQAAPRRPFQGWRYLAPEDSPRDLPKGRAADDALPEELARALAEIGLR